MYDIPFKYALITLVTVASGTASVIDDHTLIPLGIFATCTVLLTGAAWKVSSSVTRVLGRLEALEQEQINIRNELSTLRKSL